MEYSCLQLNDLPDEILLIILKNVNNVTLLYYSLFGINKRLTQILCDSIFTSHLDLMHRCSNDSVYRLPNPILDRFCLQILPKIHHKVKWLNIESSSMTRILLCTDYPNLYGLGLYNLERGMLEHLFVGKILYFDYHSF
jgi:hypothetical protein